MLNDTIDGEIDLSAKIMILIIEGTSDRGTQIEQIFNRVSDWDCQVKRITGVENLSDVDDITRFHLILVVTTGAGRKRFLLDALKRCAFRVPVVTIAPEEGEDLVRQMYETGVEDCITGWEDVELLLPHICRRAMERFHIREESQLPKESGKNGYLEKQDLFQLITELLPDLIVFVDNRLRSGFANRFLPGVMVGQPDFDNVLLLNEVLDESIYSQVEPHLKPGLEGSVQKYGVVCTVVDKQTRYYDVYHIPYSVSDDITGFLMVFRDISERKNSAEQVSRLTSAIEQVEESIIITDPDGSIDYVNPAFERITGYSAEEARDNNVRFLQSGIHDREFYKQLWATLGRGETWSGRFVNRRKDGSLFTEEATISPVRDDHGNIVNYVAVKRDISTQLEFEKQLRQAQKAESLGTLAGGVAHDFNNILTAIMGFTELSLVITEKNSPLFENLSEVYSASLRAKELVRQILTFSRQIDQSLEPIDVNPVIGEALKLLRSTLPSTIDIHYHSAERPGKILADPTQIHQIVMNLCTNAAHAMRESGGELTVDSREINLSGEHGRQYKDIPEGRYIQIRFTDTGSGIDPNSLALIFDPYYTTKEYGEGTGLGLAVVQGIIHEYRGDIRVESLPGEGTTFTVILPVIKDEIKKTNTPALEHIRKGAGEKILVVDDERAITMVCRRLLEQGGFCVHTENNSLEALSYFKKNQESIDLVLSDMTMPYMTGDKLILEILKVKPRMPAILMSGNTVHLPDALKNKSGVSILTKPIEKEVLLRRVSTLLITQ